MAAMRREQQKDAPKMHSDAVTTKKVEEAADEKANE